MRTFALFPTVVPALLALVGACSSPADEPDHLQQPALVRNYHQDAKAVLVHIHELHHFSTAWMHAITKPQVLGLISVTVGIALSLRTSTLAMIASVLLRRRCTHSRPNSMRKPSTVL